MLFAVLIVALGGALGSVSRFLCSWYISVWFNPIFPFATLFVNCLGSFFAGICLAILIEPPGGSEYWRLFLMVGILGGFTTFSAFSWETIALFNAGETIEAVMNVLTNTTFSLILAIAGLAIGRLLHSVA